MELIDMLFIGVCLWFVAIGCIIVYNHVFDIRPFFQRHPILRRLCLIIFGMPVIMLVWFIEFWFIDVPDIIKGYFDQIKEVW